jgi:hypothetical protein
MNERSIPGAALARNLRVDPAVPSAALWAVHEDYSVTLKAAHYMGPKCVRRGCPRLPSHHVALHTPCSLTKFYHLQVLKSGQSYAVWFQ